MRVRGFSLLVLLAWSWSSGCLGSRNQEDQVECLGRTPPGLIKNMLETIRFASPTEGKEHLRLLPKFTTHCGKKAATVPVISRILELYKQHVFGKLGWMTQDLQTFSEELLRLSEIVKQCMDRGSGAMSRWQKKRVKRMETIFKKLKEVDRYKAVREFHHVLVWISVHIDRVQSQEICA